MRQYADVLEFWPDSFWAYNNLGGALQSLGRYDEAALCYRWRADDPAVDRLQDELMTDVETGEANGLSRGELFHRIWERAHRAAGITALPIVIPPETTVPRMSEPWYCCAEPTSRQLAGL